VLELKEIERSIIKKYRKTLWSRFIKAVIDYELIDENDHVAVCISGGKDSLLLAKLIQELIKHGNKPFKATFLTMDPGFSKENRLALEENAKRLGIPLIIKDSNIFHVSMLLNEANPCYMCARMRRGFLYNAAVELGCNKMALGHHFNDVIETTMLNVLYAGNFKTMLPKLPSDNFPDLTLIRPLFLLREEDIIKFGENAGIKAMNCGCSVTKRDNGSKRKVIKELIRDLKKDFDNVDISIFKAAENVNIDAILGYSSESEEVNFSKIFEKRVSYLKEIEKTEEEQINRALKNNVADFNNLLVYAKDDAKYAYIRRLVGDRRNLTFHFEDEVIFSGEQGKVKPDKLMLVDLKLEELPKKITKVVFIKEFTIGKSVCRLFSIN